MRRSRPIPLHRYSVVFKRVGTKKPPILNFEALPLPDAVARYLYEYVDGYTNLRDYRLVLDLTHGSGVLNGGKLGSFTIEDQGEVA